MPNRHKRCTLASDKDADKINTKAKIASSFPLHIYIFLQRYLNIIIQPKI
jgi:hypothetical protein